jgi:hypothetical protein
VSDGDLVRSQRQRRTQEKLVSQPPPGILDGELPLFSEKPDVGRACDKGEVFSAGEFFRKSRVPLGGFSTKPVIEVSHADGERVLRPEFLEDVQQADRIGTAGKRHEHRVARG